MMKMSERKSISNIQICENNLQFPFLKKFAVIQKCYGIV